MRVSDFDEFDRFETEGLLTGSKERSWLWFGLIVSLATAPRALRLLLPDAFSIGGNLGCSK